MPPRSYQPSKSSVSKSAKESRVNRPRLLPALALILSLVNAATTDAQVLDKQKLLDAQTFWDNRDWDWYKSNIPFFECPDADVTTTYYYRWELVTKHLTYGSPNSGYSFTEFIDRPFWSGAYGAISCPAGHQLYEVRWLRDATYARDYPATGSGRPAPSRAITPPGSPTPSGPSTTSTPTTRSSPTSSPTS